MQLDALIYKLPDMGMINPLSEVAGINHGLTSAELTRTLLITHADNNYVILFILPLQYPLSITFA